MLNYKKNGKTYKIQLRIGNYIDGSLAIAMLDLSEGYPQPYAALTVNLSTACAKNCAYIDTNNLGEDIVDWLFKNNYGELTGRTKASGYCIYPEFAFNDEALMFMSAVN